MHRDGAATNKQPLDPKAWLAVEGRSSRDARTAPTDSRWGRFAFRFRTFLAGCPRSHLGSAGVLNDGDGWGSAELNGMVTANMTNNRSIALDSLIAWSLWGVGAFLALGDAVGFLPDDIGFVGISILALGHFASVHRVVAQVEHREIAAFDLGRTAGLRSIRRSAD